MKHFFIFFVLTLLVFQSKSIAQEKRVVFFKTFLAPEKERASTPTDTLSGISYDKNKKSYTHLTTYNKKEKKIYSFSISTGTEQNNGLQRVAMPAGTFMNSLVKCCAGNGSALDRLVCIVELIGEAIADCDRTGSPTDCWW